MFAISNVFLKNVSKSGAYRQKLASKKQIFARSQRFFSFNMGLEDCYKILNVSVDSDKQEIQKSYFKLAKRYHPDVNKTEEAQEIFGRIKTAYETLIEERKKEYSERIKNLKNAKEKFYKKRGYYETAKAEFDAKKAKREEEENNTISVTQKLTFEEAVFGCKKVITFDRKQRCRTCKGTKIARGGKYVKCNECHGEGMKTIILGEEEGLGDSYRFEFECDHCEGEGYTINKLCKPCKGTGHTSSKTQEEITIPPGVESNTVIKIKNLGHYIMMKGSGELWITLEVEDHPVFTRDGVDIHSDLKVNIFQAALGDRIDVEVLRGKFRVQIPRGTNQGDVLSLENLGIQNPYKLGPMKGNHYLKIFLEVPEIEDESIKSLLEQYQE
ncbi:unnamed protein product [Moneuplotes crassus]|uniref:Uncharacterized protein n=1 Tax=Euplotes crassus TaxID=5936 RepID=A0AAD1UJC3_EUPCR|nr:unnamed protein product [Moneuplotes crassus]